MFLKCLLEVCPNPINLFTDFSISVTYYNHQLSNVPARLLLSHYTIDLKEELSLKVDTPPIWCIYKSLSGDLRLDPSLYVTEVPHYRCCYILWKVNNDRRLWQLITSVCWTSIEFLLCGGLYEKRTCPNISSAIHRAQIGHGQTRMMYFCIRYAAAIRGWFSEKEVTRWPDISKVRTACILLNSCTRNTYMNLVHSIKL